MTFSARTTTSPASVSTCSVLASEKRPKPCTTRTLARLSRPATPVFSLSTTVSFQATTAAMSTCGGLARLTPWRPPGSAARRSVSTSEATWISALDGMQPRIRQVPPSRSPSTSTVSSPSWPARMAAT